MTNTAYSYGTSNSYTGTVSSSYADATYGTGSISNAYTGSDVELFGFSGSTSSVAGLGLNESLQQHLALLAFITQTAAKFLAVTML